MSFKKTEKYYLNNTKKAAEAITGMVDAFDDVDAKFKAQHASLISSYARTIIDIMKEMSIKGLILFLILPLTTLSQPDTLFLSGYLAGAYTAKETIIVQDTVQTWDVTLQIGDCDTLDQYIPGIAVLKDECIRDEEWFGISNYSNVIQDSADFYTEDFLNLVKYFGVASIDDCGIDSFYVKSVEIIPPGGVDRPGETTREFQILFRAVDWVGHVKEAVMRWVRVPDSMGCY